MTDPITPEDIELVRTTVPYGEVVVKQQDGVIVHLQTMRTWHKEDIEKLRQSLNTN